MNSTATFIVNFRFDAAELSHGNPQPMEFPMSVISVVPVIASIAALLIGGFILAPSARIETEIEIDAPPSVVWEILSDLEGHASWNPFLVSMQGKLEQGATLTNTMRQASGKEMTFRPTVLVVTPEQELRWRGQLWLPRLFDGEH